MSINSASALSLASQLSSRYNNNNDRISLNTRSQHALQRVSNKKVLSVRNVTIPVTRYPKAEDINSRDDYMKLSFGQQYLYFNPFSMNERNHPELLLFQKKLFYGIPGLLQRNSSIIPQRILNHTKLIEDDQRYDNREDESSGDENSSNFS